MQKQISLTFQVFIQSQPRGELTPEAMKRMEDIRSVDFATPEERANEERVVVAAVSRVAPESPCLCLVRLLNWKGDVNPVEVALGACREAGMVDPMIAFTRRTNAWLIDAAEAVCPQTLYVREPA